MRNQILVAGIGNIFLADDAFGVEAAQQLMRRQLPPEVKVVECGIRGYDLAVALTEDYDAVILVDATPLGQPPGTAYLIEPDLSGMEAPEPEGESHDLTPMRALQMARAWGGRRPGRLYVAGCEPASLESLDGRIGLSPEAAAAIPRVLEMIETLITELLEKKLDIQPGPARA
jgi:hydrogenase maturation protease